MTANLRDLADPRRLIPHLQVKVQTFSKDKKKALMVGYIDARDAAQILDDVVGPDGWSSRVTQPPVKMGEGWTALVDLTVGGVSREDFGTGTGGLDNGAKGAVSDALKRAAVQFGVGRGLYSLSTQRAPTHEWATGKFDVRDAEKQKILKRWRGELQILAASWSEGLPLPPPAADEDGPMDTGDDTPAAPAAAAAPAEPDVNERARLLIELAGERKADVGVWMRAEGLSREALADPETWARAQDHARALGSTKPDRREVDDPPGEGSEDRGEPALAGQTTLGGSL